MESFKIDSLIRPELIHNTSNLQHCIKQKKQNQKQYLNEEIEEKIKPETFSQKATAQALLGSSKLITDNLAIKNSLHNQRISQQSNLFLNKSNSNNNNNNIVQFLMNYASNSTASLNRNTTEKTDHLISKSLVNNGILLSSNLNQMIMMPSSVSSSIFLKESNNLDKTLTSNSTPENNNISEDSDSDYIELENHKNNLLKSAVINDKLNLNNIGANSCQNFLHNQNSIFVMPQLFGASTSSSMSMAMQMDSDDDSSGELCHNSASTSPNAFSKNQIKLAHSLNGK